MSGIGTTGFIVILIVALLLFGPKKLPELGSSIGRAMREFRSAAKELTHPEEGEARNEQTIASHLKEETK